jgi:hypothetical protein
MPLTPEYTTDHNYHQPTEYSPFYSSHYTPSHYTPSHSDYPHSTTDSVWSQLTTCEGLGIDEWIQQNMESIGHTAVREDNLTKLTNMENVGEDIFYPPSPTNSCSSYPDIQHEEDWVNSINMVDQFYHYNTCK